MAILLGFLQPCRFQVEFPKIYARDGEDYKVRWGEEFKPVVSCTIPQAGFTLHTRCIVCRMDENGVLQSLEEGDYEKFVEYLPIK